MSNPLSGGLYSGSGVTSIVEKGLDTLNNSWMGYAWNLFNMGDERHGGQYVRPRYRSYVTKEGGLNHVQGILHQRQYGGSVVGGVSGWNRPSVGSGQGSGGGVRGARQTGRVPVNSFQASIMGFNFNNIMRDSGRTFNGMQMGGGAGGTASTGAAVGFQKYVPISLGESSQAFYDKFKGWKGHETGWLNTLLQSEGSKSTNRPSQKVGAEAYQTQETRAKYGTNAFMLLPKHDDERLLARDRAIMFQSRNPQNIMRYERLSQL